MTRIVHPSAKLSGTPSAAVDVPEEWEPVHLPGAVTGERAEADDAIVRDQHVTARVSTTPGQEAHA
jgi:hypothetical protein